MTKLHASTIHLFISTIIFLAFLCAIFFVLYPPPYFGIDGSWKKLEALAGIYFTLGPLLTLILFKPGKPGLKFDMSCIVLAQLAALLYGGTLIYQQRPAFVVFGVDRFTTVPAADVDFDQLRYPELKRIAGIGPILAEAKPPKDPKQRQALLFGVLLEGQKDLEFRAELYEPYHPDLRQLHSRNIDIHKIATLNADAERAIDAFIASQGGRLKITFTCRSRAKTGTSLWYCPPRTGCRWVSSPSTRGWRIIEKRVQVLSFASALWSRMRDDRL